MRADDALRQSHASAESDSSRPDAAHGPLTPESPFIWPEPRVLEGLRRYSSEPPVRDLALQSRAIFGFVSALTGAGNAELQFWLERNPDLQISLILQVYPTSSTRQ